MKALSLFAGLTLMVGVSSVWAADTAFDPDKLPQVACSQFKFSPAILEKYPSAPAACLGGVMYNGQKYAKYNGRVFLPMTDRITLEILDPQGNVATTFSYKPAPTQVVMVNGNPEQYKDLRKGEIITFWIPESRLDVKETPASTHNSWTVTPPLK
jgi:hypothetical protein